MNDLITAVEYSYNEATWVTALAIGLLMYRIFQSISTAYKENTSYAQMKEKGDRMALIQFYVAIGLSVICVFIFFLPYLMNFKG